MSALLVTDNRSCVRSFAESNWRSACLITLVFYYGKIDSKSWLNWARDNQLPVSKSLTGSGLQKFKACNEWRVTSSFLVSNSTSKHLSNILDDFRAVWSLFPLHLMIVFRVTAIAKVTLRQVNLFIAGDSGNVWWACSLLPKVAVLADAFYKLGMKITSSVNFQW